MAQALNACLGAVAAALFWTCLGLPIARRLMPGSLALPIAPALGWAVHSAIALPIFFLMGFSTATVLATAALALAAAVGALMTTAFERDALRVPAWMLVAAAVVALGPAAAILPKVTGDGVALAAPIFDHAKIAIVDEMVRLGLPPGNPFLGPVQEPHSRLTYYYLWHFSAAELALATGISGWEADAAMTWFTAFSSLMLMVGCTVWLSGRAGAGLWALLLAVAGSLRPVLAAVTGADTLQSFMRAGTGFGGWYFQLAWSPQNVAAATCVVLAVMLLGRSVGRRGPLLLVTLALVLAAAFESSTWLGGVVLPAAAVVTGLLLLAWEPRSRRVSLLAWSAATAVLAVIIAAPLLHDQITAAAMRADGAAIALQPFPVLGDLFPQPLRAALDLPAYWLLLLVVEFPAVYLTGLLALRGMLRPNALGPEQRRAVALLAALTVVSLTISWLLASRIGDNNDLGWRAVLPGAMVLTVFAAVGLSGWLATGTRVAATAGIAALLLGLPEAAALIHGNVVGTLAPSGKTFARTPAMWAAVRRHAAPGDRIGNNPLFLQDLTPWPVNLSWALLSNRRSCFAGRELALPYTSLPRARREAIEAQFIRVFAGEASPDDIRDLATRYDCRLVIVTAQDGAWARDPFAASELYRLVEAQDGHWKIYRAR
jgi:hypothetical protein